MQRLRTPEERFSQLTDFGYESHFAEVADPTGEEKLRMAYLDEGPREGPVFVLLHGEPTWSYLYRHVIAPLVDSGYRVVAPDLIGFGKSDKPTPRSEYTYARMVEWLRELLFDHLDLSEVCVFAQDWGSLLGLRLVAEHPERFARVALGNGGLPTGEEHATEAFMSWRSFSQEVPELPVGRIVAGGCAVRPGADVVGAYDAPFPDETFKEGARQMPLLVPISSDDPAHADNVRAWESLRSFDKPFLCCFSDGDAITRGADRKFREEVPGARGVTHVTIEGGGHFLQEDRGPELAQVLLNFVATTPK